MNTVIIGASRGLGLCLTKQALENGLRVAAGTRSMTSGLMTLKQAYPDSLLMFEADVTDERQIEEGARQCVDFLGEIDSVCVTVGALLDGDRVNLLHECDMEELKRTFEVNLFGPLNVVKKFCPFLKAGANFFIVTSEGVAVNNCGSWIPCYALSKTAATKACGILSQSVPHLNFYAVHPGRMNTDMGKTTAQIEPEVSAEGLCRLLSGETPLFRDEWYIDYNGNTMPF